MRSCYQHTHGQRQKQQRVICMPWQLLLQAEASWASADTDAALAAADVAAFAATCCNKQLQMKPRLAGVQSRLCQGIMVTLNP